MFAHQHEDMKTPKPNRPAKPKPWNHQRELDAAVGRRIMIGFTGGGEMEAKLLAADQFTLQIEVGDKTITWFKHGIAGYQVL